MAEIHRFGDFTLDPAERTLRRGGVTVDLNGRYLDALILLVSEAGTLVGKNRFLREVWHGVPVTDEALTQCVKMLRQRLGDDAARPRYIETVPRHGYRFIGELAPVTTRAAPSALREILLLAGAGTLGAGLAGVVGGVFYGSVLAAQQPAASGSGASVLLVILWLTIVAALVGGAGVSLGIAAARGTRWSVAGGAAGGFVIGGVVKLLGIDAFNLLLGRSPAAITGAPEGLVLGGAVGLGVWLSRDRPVRSAIVIAAAAGAAGALLIVALGGTLMGGSLAALARTFPGSRLHLAALGQPVTFATAAMEGALLAGCIAGATMLARRRL